LIALSKELEALRQSFKRSAPYGSASSVQRTAQRLNLQWTLRPRGRPRVRPIAKQ
jgi:putative transposase